MRRVRTPEGSRYFDAPIGSPITAAMLDAARGRNKGKSPPRGATTQSRATPKVPERPKAALPQRPDVQSKQPQLGPIAKVKAKSAVSSEAMAKPTFKPKPSISGPVKIKVGDAEFGAPASSRVFKSAKTDKVAYVVTPDGNVHVFSELGEVELDSTNQARIAGNMAREADRFTEESNSGDSGTDFSKVKPEDLDLESMGAEEKKAFLDSAPEGTKVFTDREQFTKLPDGWTGEGGVSASTDRIAKEDLHASKEDAQQKTADRFAEEEAARKAAADSAPDTADIQAMDPEEFDAMLETLPEGARLYVDHGAGFSTPLTKSANGWADSEGVAIDPTNIDQTKVKKNRDDKIQLPKVTIPPRTETKQDFTAKLPSTEELKSLSPEDLKDLLLDLPDATKLYRANTGGTTTQIHKEDDGKWYTGEGSEVTPDQLVKDQKNLQAEPDEETQARVLREEREHVAKAEREAKGARMASLRDSEAGATAKDLDSGETFTKTSGGKWKDSKGEEHMWRDLADRKMAVAGGITPEGRIRPARKPDSLGTAPAPAPDEIEALKLSPFSAPFINPDGSFNEERTKLHDAIIADFLDGLEEQEFPVQYMNGGGPASGKGTMTKGKNAELTRYPSARKVNDVTFDMEPVDPENKPGALLIDPDAIKMQIPEVKQANERIKTGEFDPEDTKWAAYSHEESSQLAKRLHMAALERGYNVIYDGTGNSSPASVKKKVQAAKDMGYRIEANYLALDPNEGVQRAQRRAARANRVVPESVIRKTYEVLPPLFDAVKDDDTFDSVKLFDNNVERGMAAKLIGQGDGKTFEILDQSAYDNYLNAGNKKDDTSAEAKAAATGGIGSAAAAREANK